MIRTRGVDRRVIYWLARQMYAGRTTDRPDQGNIRRVLVVRVDERVGNLIMIQSTLDALRKHLPGLELGLLSSIHMKRVTESLEGVDRLHEVDKRWFYRHPLRWHALIRDVRRVAYQAAIDASAWHTFSMTHAALTRFSGAPVTIGFRRRNDDGLSAQDHYGGFHTHLVEPGPQDQQELKQHMRLLTPLGIRTEPPVLHSDLGKLHQKRWMLWFESLSWTGARIGIWAGSRKTERRWALENYLELSKRLYRELSAGILILWGPGEEKIRDRLALDLTVNTVVAPATSLSELAGILRGLDLLITNDTGPMHLSVAVGTPTLALFPSGEPRRWGHSYSFVDNLAVPGKDSGQLDRIMDACRRLLGRGRS